MHEWIERARSGDRAAAAELANRLRPRLEKMAHYYARRCGEDADDLLQEAWLGLLRAMREVDVSIGSPEQFLIRHARWRMLDAVKRARLRRCAPLEHEELLEAPLTRPAEEAVDSASLGAFIGQLKSSQREVLECLLAGLTWREAGSVLGCTSANVAYYVRQIRSLYAAWEAEPS